MLDVDSQSSGSRGTLAPPEPRAGSWAAAIEAVLLLDASTGPWHRSLAAWGSAAAAGAALFTPFVKGNAEHAKPKEGKM